MKLFETHFAKRARAGFTLAEVLAALFFMAIVIPVALQALNVSARAADMASRRPVAARLAERLLNETIVNRQSNLGLRKGTTDEEGLSLEWTVKTDLWEREGMRQLTAEVFYNVQGRAYSVVLTTLVLR